MEMMDDPVKKQSCTQYLGKDVDAGKGRQGDVSKLEGCSA